MRNVFLLIGAALMAVGCGGNVPGLSPGATLPPINLPSNLPTLPDLGLPTPVGGLSPACQLVTDAEMSSLIGESMSVSSSAAMVCTWSSASVTPSVIIRYDTAETIQVAKLAFPNGRDLSVGGNAAYYADVGALYIDKGGRPLVIQTIWSLQGDAAVQKITQIAELAASRF